MAVCTAWGMYPKIDCTRYTFSTEDELRAVLDGTPGVIPHGNGRSYGDSALGEHMVDTRPNGRILGFDESSGILHVQSGVLLSEILEQYVPRGWFLKVTPGTKLITVGGAIASDVHGKNHHVDGCFSESVEEFSIMLADGSVVTCSREGTPELWKATCGGQGLTGIILDAKIRLKPVNSRYISQTTIKTRNLRETFEAFEQYASVPYSVAWIDCLARGDSMGRSLLMVGDFCDDGDLNYSPRRAVSIPFTFPGFVLGKWTVKAFNWLYYSRIGKTVSHQKVGIDTFFYPLDSIGHWNRIYGRQGFTQYQFILPRQISYEGLREILSAIAQSGRGSFLAVLKLYGPSNGNWLSFPMEGYGLALDFKIEKGLFGLLDRLDQIVLRYGGRIYLSKDARVSREVFEQGYPDIGKFREFRKDNGMDRKFRSLQSERLGL